MQYVYQPENSNLCGPACVASLLDITLDKACRLVGKRGLTRTRHIREALEKEGVTLGPRLQLRDRMLGRTYMARVRGKDWKHTHWVVLLADGHIFDPATGIDPVWWGGHISSIYLADTMRQEIREMSLQATRMLDTIDREELSFDKYQTLKNAVKLVHEIRHRAGG